MFLVMMRAQQDDLPLYWSHDQGHALKFARQADWIPDSRTCELFHADVSSPVCILIVEFRNGKPWDTQIVRRYEEELVAEEQAEKQEEVIRVYDPDFEDQIDY